LVVGVAREGVASRVREVAFRARGCWGPVGRSRFAVAIASAPELNGREWVVGRAVWGPRFPPTWIFHLELSRTGLVGSVGGGLVWSRLKPSFRAATFGNG